MIHHATAAKKLSAQEVRGRAHPIRWRLLLAGFLITTPPLFVPFHFADNREFWERLMDAVHLPYFAGITILVYLALRVECLCLPRRVFVAGTATLAWAAAVEFLQPLTGRTKDIVDFRNGALGIALAICFLLWPRRWVFIVLIGAGASAFISQPAWLEARGMWWRASHFPELGDFESDAELRLWITPEPAETGSSNTWLQRSSLFVSHGQYSLQVTTNGPGYPGVRFLAAGQDWRPYQTLACDVYNPASPFHLALRIDDAQSIGQSDRYTASLPIAPGWNQIRIPMQEIAKTPSGLLHLGAIRRVLLFLDSPGGGKRTFYLDHVRLE